MSDYEEDDYDKPGTADYIAGIAAVFVMSIFFGLLLFGIVVAFLSITGCAIGIESLRPPH